MASHANPAKAKGYAFSLNLVRSLGLWTSTSTFPSSVARPTYITLNAASGSVDWSELLRKYLKHNSGSIEAELVAAQTRLELAVWQAIDRREQTQSHGSVLRRRQNRALETGLSPKGKETAREPLSDEWIVTDRNDSRAIREALDQLQHLLANQPSDSPAASGSYTLIALAKRTRGDHVSCLKALQSAKVSATANKADVATHDLDLQILATVLRGLALEQLAEEEAKLNNTSAAQEAQSEALQAYQNLPLEPPPPVPEAQRYMEVGLSRLAFLASDSGDSSTHATLAAQRKYFGAARSFSSTPPHKRMLMYHAHLTTILSYLLTNARTSTSDASRGDAVDINKSDVHETFTYYEQLLLNNASLAKFPRAGDPTHNMYAYMALLYAFWELSYLPSQWVVDSLYRALTRTFASQRLHRYLVLVLSTMALTEGDRRAAVQYADDAIRNLRLYVKLFDKSRETDQVAVQREVNAFRRRREGEEAVPEVDDPEEESNPLETDEDFCRVACIGTRLLLVESGKDGKQEQEDDRLDLIEEAMKLSEKALKVLELQQTKENTDKDKVTGQDGNAQPQSLPVPPGKEPRQRKEDSGVIAEVNLWYGIAQAEFALAEADPETGRSKAKTALKSLVAAVDSLSYVKVQMEDGLVGPKDSYLTSSIQARALYSLAYAQLEVRDVNAAAITARRAVEALQTTSGADEAGLEHRIWHLLALTISAKKEWAKAKSVAEMALSEVMELEEEEDSIEASRFANTPVADDDESQVDAVAKKVSIVTPGDAPHDPMSTGNPAVVISGEASQGDSGSSSFINVSNPNDQPSGTSKDYATGETGSDLASLARKRKISRSESAESAGRQHLMLHHTTTSWEDLEAEIDLWITRNRCIEATEGPEVALQDLQRNVFTRFSTRRDELEDEERRRLAANTAATKLQPASAFPYASQAMQKSPSLRRKLDHQRAHTVSGADSPGRARSLIGTIGLRSRARTNSARVEPQPDKDHLGIPRPSSRPDSIHSNESNATSVSGSHLVGANASMTANTVRSAGVNGTHPSTQQHPHSARILSKLWLTSAASFRRWGKLDECRGAINEAEDLAGETDPDIWVQYALYLQVSAASPAATDMERIYLSLQKAIAISTDYVPAVITISKIHLEQGKWAMAEGFLDVATQTNAWDSPEAWFLLAKVYEATKRDGRARECLLYALELEQSRPIRELRSVLTRWV